MTFLSDILTKATNSYKKGRFIRSLFININMAQVGSLSKPARVRVQTEERGTELVALCNMRGWQVIVGIEPDKEENIDDIIDLQNRINTAIIKKYSPSKNGPCPCESGKQYKRCCGK